MNKIDLKSMAAGVVLAFALVLGVAATTTPTLPMEFQVAVGNLQTGDLRNKMNKFGREGWEFVATSGAGPGVGYAIFRRATALPGSTNAAEKATAVPKSELKERFLGAWQLVSFADGRVSEANVGELKFIGDRHWSVSHLNLRTKRLDYHMGGTYTLNGDEYIETIEFANDAAADVIGKEFTYKIKIEGENFTQTGVGNPYSLVFRRAK